MKEKVVIVTGSTRGIGYEIGLSFLKQGAFVVFNGRKPLNDEWYATLAPYHTQMMYVEGAVQEAEDAKRIVEETIATYGRVDILINNAGITRDGLLMRMDSTDFTEVINVNLVGTFQMTQAVTKTMLKQRSGAIINIASVVGLIGNAGQTNYAASKAGVVGFTKSVARELASRGITCNAIAPGFIESDMTAILSEKVKEQAMKQIPLGCFGQAEDVARAALFIAKQSYMTGQVLNVDGGMVMNG
ncbi:3-oxoacyl-[acyl-carrier-protein] reductase [Vagococcus lutrae]|uniref:3-oxoacyl-[acyl-carrier-protein] reductase n=1 Tax=Vagococcus lutrae TaxID=81947 RepID=UPI00289173FC|nr:3-oxoacyl-[acyl-carrier-protein] reductase [Vagococcus lutrae]MDT2816851.1 3-oxoacyl-[acyl-carrier-protein] reductase [Vagococcus lutrae]